MSAEGRTAVAAARLKPAWTRWKARRTQDCLPPCTSLDHPSDHPPGSWRSATAPRTLPSDRSRHRVLPQWAVAGLQDRRRDRLDLLAGKLGVVSAIRSAKKG